MTRSLLSRFRDDAEAAVLIESLIVMSVLLLTLVAFVELTLAIYQWNQATKALQVGSRLASVSNPVDASVSSFDPVKLSIGFDPGDKLPIGTMGTRTCTAKVKPDATVEGTCTTGTFDAAAMRRLVFGGDYDTDPTCGAPFDGQTGMCDMLPLIVDSERPATIIVRYEDAGLGYAGRMDGGVPVISITIADLRFRFLMLNRFMETVGLSFPPIAISAVGEDLDETHI